MFRTVNKASADALGEITSKAAIYYANHMVATEWWQADDIRANEDAAAEMAKATGEGLGAFGVATTMYIFVWPVIDYPRDTRNKL